MITTYAIDALCGMRIKTDEATLSRLADIYCAGFRGPPWNEPWTPQTALEELTFLLTNEAVFFAAFAENGTTNRSAQAIAGWVTGLPVVKHHHYKQLVALGVPEDALWLSDIVVHPDAQHQGLGKRLTVAFTSGSHERGIRTIASRTRKDTFQYPIFLKTGYQVLKEAEFETGGVLQPQVVFLHRGQ